MWEPANLVRKADEKLPARVAYVYGVHLRGGEKILASRSRTDRGRRRVSIPEPEER